MNTSDPGARIDDLRRAGYQWSEIGRHLGTTGNAARHTHRRWRAGRDQNATPPHPLTDPAPSARDTAGSDAVSPALPRAEHDRTGERAGGSEALLKSEIELARAHIKKVTVAEVRLRHSILAEREINEVLAQRLRDFDLALQSGVRKLAQEKNLSVLMVLHDLNLAGLYADRVALMSQGRIYSLGKPGEVITAENLSAVYHVSVNVIPHPEYGTPLVLPDGKNGPQPEENIHIQI